MATSKKPMPLLVRAKETTPPSVRTGGRLVGDLSALSRVNNDLRFIVENPKDGMAYYGTYAQFKAAIAAKAYGIMQTVDGDTSSPQASMTIGGGSPVTAAELMSTWTSNGISSDATVDHTTDKITATVAGIYEVAMSISFSGSGGKTYVVTIYHDDISASPTATATTFKMARKLGVGGDVGSATLTGLVDMAVGDSVMCYVHSTDGGTDFLVHQAQLLIAQV